MLDWVLSIRAVKGRITFGFGHELALTWFENSSKKSIFGNLQTSGFGSGLYMLRTGLVMIAG
jgi:hypothetical protein